VSGTVGLTVDQAAIVGVLAISLHELRHTDASQLLMAGMDVKVVSESVGHASVRVTLGTYAHVMPANSSRPQQRPLRYWESDD
jgi:site-specific recombinase XerD